LLPKQFIIEANKNEIEKCIYPPIEQWLRSFLDAKFIITDSFHGTIFSIIFEKPFIVIGNKKRGLSRFNSLLKMFRLEERMIDKNDKFDFPTLSNNIKYDDTSVILQEKHQDSILFLKTFLM
jgi:exopolysaccharide biosynthesis predicted pyruvyltransferase EpsI